MSDSIKINLDKFDSRFRSLAIREGIASFDMYRGLEHEDLNKIETEMSALWNEKSTIEIAEAKVKDKALARSARLVALGVLRNKVEGIEEIFTAKNAANQKLVDFRPSLDGQPISRTDLGELLRWEADPVRRRKAAGVFVPLEKELKDLVLDLINKRNAAAKELGFQSYPHLAFELNELDLEEVKNQLRKLLDEGADSFRALLDEYRDRPEMSPGQLYSSDLNFLHENYLPNLPRENFLADKLIDGIRAGYSAIGLDLEKLPIKTVIQDIPAGGFCFTIDPGADVRILANPRDGQSWYQVLFHEFGHAVQGSTAKGDGHYLVALGDPGFFWEGIAVLFEKASLRKEFLMRYVDDPVAVEGFEEGVRKRLAYRIRRLAMDALFEYSIYLEPAGYDELTKRRADMFRSYFFVEPALDPPTWTHDIFHITHPCYIQNYVLAEIMAFHLLSGSQKNKSDAWTPGFTGKIVDVLLVPGAMKTWREKVKGFSGSVMGPEALIREVFK